MKNILTAILVKKVEKIDDKIKKVKFLKENGDPENICLRQKKIDRLGRKRTAMVMWILCDKNWKDYYKEEQD